MELEVASVRAGWAHGSVMALTPERLVRCGVERRLRRHVGGRQRWAVGRTAPSQAGGIPVVSVPESSGSVARFELLDRQRGR